MLTPAAQQNIAAARQGEEGQSGAADVSKYFTESKEKLW
jgi:hypothetical protein